ncbi:disulfide bond formation protein B [Candidatus Woesearchaeota archaeon]|nr:disulfide bond formation protein B [Candidatus Woesearchaeota archaeon]
MNLDFLPAFLGLGTLLLHILIVIFILIFIIEKLSKKKILVSSKRYFLDNSNLLSFLMAASATIISLIYSEIILLEPCNLCWYQRVFIYPLSVMFLIALIKKDSKVRIYALPLAVIGALIASYHYTIQMFNLSSFCDITSLVPCNTIYILEFGYITIPLMSLTAFVVIILLNLKKN